MRIDVLRTATQQADGYRQGDRVLFEPVPHGDLHVRRLRHEPGLTTIQSLTTNLTTAKTSAAAIDLMTVPYQNYAGDTAHQFR